MNAPAKKPPDLARLIELHGGYGRVTTAAWHEYDEAQRAWNEARKQELLAEVMKNEGRRR